MRTRKKGFTVQTTNANYETKKGLTVQVEQKTVIINPQGKIVAIIPDYTADGTAQAIAAILNKERSIILPE